MPWLADFMADTGRAAAYRSALNGARDTPPSCLPVIRDEHPASPAAATTDAPVHTTPVRATEQTAARATEPPLTTLPAPTEPAAPVAPPCAQGFFNAWFE